MKYPKLVKSESLKRTCRLKKMFGLLETKFTLGCVYLEPKTGSPRNNGGDAQINVAPTLPSRVKVIFILLPGCTRTGVTIDSLAMI